MIALRILQMLSYELAKEQMRMQKLQLEIQQVTLIYAMAHCNAETQQENAKFQKK